jgi:PKHD-type hydroxylase
MFTIIENVLDAEQLAACTGQLALADWRDGRITAGPQSARVKHNQQVAEDCPHGKAWGQTILSVLERHPVFLSAALPRHVFPLLFNRYGPGMGFGPHIDNAIRPIPGTNYRIRTDLSATLFLAPPESYDGGELIIAQGDIQHEVKLAAGDMVLYPASTLHQVTKVTRGERLAAFFWVQSLVKDAAQRAILFEMDSAIRELTLLAPDAPALPRLTGCYHNLVRSWTEM